jgi:hypothetical protein
LLNDVLSLDKMLLSYSGVALGLVVLLETVTAGAFTVEVQNGRKECTVQAGGHKEDDSPAILAAFNECNNGGKIVFPASQNYWIASRLKATLTNVDIEWRGRWTVRTLLPSSVLTWSAVLRRPLLLAPQLLPHRLPEPRRRLRPRRAEHRH